MLIDPSKTALENLFGLISESAGVTITPADIQIGKPQPWKSIYAMERNTSVDAVRMPGSTYNGPLQFYYRRENLSEYDGVLNYGIPSDTVIDLELLESILRNFGIIAEECSFGTTSPNLNNDGKYQITVSAKSTSYVYQGNSTLIITPDTVTLIGRLTEDGEYRVLEDGSIRLLEL